MSVLSALFGKAVNLDDAFQASDITSSAMSQAIAEWNMLYFNKTATDDEDPCQQIPYTIVRKITKTAFSEYEFDTKDGYADRLLRSLERHKGKAMQLSLISGECALKPIPSPAGWNWAVISRTAMSIFGRDINGNVTDVGTIEQSKSGKWVYTLLERRTVDNGYLTLRNMLYRSEDNSSIGSRVPLATMPRYAELPDEYTFPERMDSTGLVFLRTPIENNVDGSNDAVSVYSAAVGLIHNINRNEAELNGEFSRGKSRVFVSDDLMKRDRNGKKSFSDTLFTALDGNPAEIGVTAFSPSLRDESYHRRKQDYLKACESVIGLKRGILSEVEETQKTATEITSSDGDYNLTIVDFQKMWTDAVAEAMRICGILGKMYRVNGAHEIAEDAWSISYGDGVLYNPEKEEAMRFKQVSAGLLKPERYIGWYYDLPADTEAQRAKIRREYMPDVLDDSGGE